MMHTERNDDEPYPPDARVPSHHPGAVRFLERHARITQLPGGSWRVWLRSAGIRVYGSTREKALSEAVQRVRGRPISELLPNLTHRHHTIR